VNDSIRRTVYDAIRRIAHRNALVRQFPADRNFYSARVFDSFEAFSAIRRIVQRRQ